MPLRSNHASVDAVEQVSAVDTLTAFVDLLGAGRALLELDRLNSDDLEQQDATPLVQKSVGAILKMREVLEGSFRNFSEPDAETEVPERLSRVWEDLQRGETRVCWFSDCASINVIVDPANIIGTLRDASTLLFSLAYSTLALAELGQLIRGGIDMGHALDLGANEMLGSGMVHAYRLESSIASYPRICIGGRFLGFLKACESSSELDRIGCSDLHREIIPRAIEVIRSLIIEDLDGVPRVDFTAPWIAFSGHEAGLSLPGAALDGVAAALEGVDPQRQPDVYKKYSWMRSILTIAIRKHSNG